MATTTARSLTSEQRASLAAELVSRIFDVEAGCTFMDVDELFDCYVDTAARMASAVLAGLFDNTNGFESQGVQRVGSDGPVIGLVFTADGWNTVCSSGCAWEIRVELRIRENKRGATVTGVDVTTMDIVL